MSLHGCLFMLSGCKVKCPPFIAEQDKSSPSHTIKVCVGNKKREGATFPFSDFRMFEEVNYFFLETFLVVFLAVVFFTVAFFFVVAAGFAAAFLEEAFLVVCFLNKDFSSLVF